MSMPKNFLHATTGLVVRVDVDEGGGYFALVPALPGCGSQGETVQETLTNVNDALMTVLDVIRQKQPERFEQILGSVTSAGEEGVEPSSTRMELKIVASA